MKLVPLKDYLIAENEKTEDKTKSGLFLPEQSQEKPRIAVVIAIGKNVEELKVGDRIVYKGYSTTEIKEDGKEYLILKEEDCLTKVEK